MRKEHVRNGFVVVQESMDEELAALIKFAEQPDVQAYKVEGKNRIYFIQLFGEPTTIGRTKRELEAAVGEMRVMAVMDARRNGKKRSTNGTTPTIAAVKTIAEQPPPPVVPVPEPQSAPIVRPAVRKRASIPNCINVRGPVDADEFIAKAIHSGATRMVSGWLIFYVRFPGHELVEELDEDTLRSRLAELAASAASTNRETDTRASESIDGGSEQLARATTPAGDTLVEAAPKASDNQLPPAAEDESSAIEVSPVLVAVALAQNESDTTGHMPAEETNIRLHYANDQPEGEFAPTGIDVIGRVPARAGYTPRDPAMEWIFSPANPAYYTGRYDDKWRAAVNQHYEALLGGRTRS